MNKTIPISFLAFTLFCACMTGCSEERSVAPPASSSANVADEGKVEQITDDEAQSDGAASDDQAASAAGSDL